MDLTDLAVGALGAVAVGAAGLVVLTGLRRYPTADHVPGRLIQRQGRLRGYVVAVNDGDNVRVYHTPWLRRWTGRPTLQRGELVKNSIHIRLAGVDAPEGKHFGKPGQPYAAEALAFLRRQALHRFVVVQLHHRDPYTRLVGTVWCRTWIPFVWRNLSLELAKAGFATVYEGHGAVYGSYLKKYQLAEKQAREQRLGMWAQDAAKYESPMAYKRRIREELDLAIENDSDANVDTNGNTPAESMSTAATVSSKPTSRRKTTKDGTAPQNGLTTLARAKLPLPPESRRLHALQSASTTSPGFHVVHK